MSFSVSVQLTGGGDFPVPSGVTLHPVRFGWSAIGGAKDAEIVARGERGGLSTLLTWLGYRVLIRNDGGDPVWWGFIAEATINLGAYSYGLSLDTMYNRVAVAYSYTDVNNELQRGTTDWHENQPAVARYGAKELLYSHADLEGEDDADDLAQKILAEVGAPIPYVRAASGEENTVTLACWGWWARTGWRYYKQLRGKEAHESYFADHPLGAGLATNHAMFRKGDKTIYGLGSQDAFRSGMRIVVAGSAHNNGVKTVGSNTQQDELSYSANTISFEPSNDLWDSAEGFDGFEPGDTIVLQGSTEPQNIRNKQIDEVNLHVEKTPGSGVFFDHIELTSDVTPQAAGPTIAISRRSFTKVEEELVDEDPGPLVTVVVYSGHMAQSFSLEHDAGSWALHEVRLRIRKIGEPADGVTVSLHSNSGGLPGALIESATLAASAMGSEMGWETWTFGGTNNLVYGTTYWLDAVRTGGYDAENYYELSIDDADTYPRGELWVYASGPGWSEYPEGGALAFQVLGKQATNTQLETMLLDSGAFDSAQSVVTGVLHPLYREGDDLIADEVERLLTRGTDVGLGLMTYVTPERKAMVTTRPGKTARYLVSGDGRVLDMQGKPLPAGTPVAGAWARLEEPGLADFAPDARTFFVEEADYDAIEGRWQLQPEGAPDAFDIGLQQG